MPDTEAEATIANQREKKRRSRRTCQAFKALFYFITLTRRAHLFILKSGDDRMTVMVAGRIASAGLVL